MNNSLLLKRLRQANHPKSRKLGMLFAASPLKNRSYSCNNAIPEYIEAAACEIYEALHAFLRYDHIPNPNGGPDLPWVAEIRIPVVREINPKTGKTYEHVEATWFDKDHIDDLTAVLASHWCQPPGILGPYEKYAEGIYWTINPVSPGHLENYGSQLERRKKGTTTDNDIVARYWLPLYADATRRDPVTGASIKVVSSTDDEKAKIAKLVAKTREYLVGDLGWPEPVQVDTGNGYADYYALPGLPIPRCPDPENLGCLKYDAAADTLVRDVIHAIAARFKNELGSIDDAVFNPSRVMKVPGTYARKVKHTSTRPHRASKLLHVPPTITPVTVEQLNRVLGPAHAAPNRGHAAPKRPATRRARPNGHRAGAGVTRPEGGGQQGQAPGKSPLERAKGYIDKVPGAVSGNGGHQTTWEALVLPIRRFDLPRDAAEELAAYYNERCEPPWSEAELAHKLNDIYSDRYKADDWGKYIEDEPAEDAEASETEDSESGLNVPVNNPKRLAKATLTQQFAHPEGSTLHHWGGTWWAWRDAAYALTEPEIIEDIITRVAELEFERDHRDKLAAYHARQAKKAD